MNRKDTIRVLVKMMETAHDPRPNGLCFSEREAIRMATRDLLVIDAIETTAKEEE